MKKTRLLSLLLVLALALALIPASTFAAPVEDGEFTVTISFEGLTLGQGFYIEPKTYTLSEINNILGTSYTGDDDLMADQVTKALFTELGIDSELQGSWGGSSFYLGAVKFGKDILNRPVNVPKVLTDNGVSADGGRSREEWLEEFDYNYMAGWMITVDHCMIPCSAGAYPVEDGSVIRWRFTLYGYGADQGLDSGWGMPAFFTAANMDALYREYARQAREGILTADAKAAALKTMTVLDATQEQADAALATLAEAGKPVEATEAPTEAPTEVPTEPEATEVPAEPEAPREPQDVSSVLNDTLAQMRATCTEPVFGTTGGEWTVLALARSGYLPIDDPYFDGYYDRIVKTVDETILDGGKLHTAKLTENSRLILALSAIGRDSRDVGGHDITAALNVFGDVTYQGINGPIFALIALDTWNFETEEPTIRQQCVGYILDKQKTDGGWALSGTKADPDITAMALEALANYRSQPEVETAVQRGIDCMSAMQQENGGYASWGSINSESCAQVVTACAALGINPDTDARFIKNGNSAVDALLAFYDPATKSFKHDMAGAGVGAMSTDQAAYALVAYRRLLNGQNSLYDMTDVKPAETPDVPDVPDLPDDPSVLSSDLKATMDAIGIAGQVPPYFSIDVSIENWDNDAHYKLLDCIVDIPEELEIDDGGTGKDGVCVDDYLLGGKVRYNLDENGKLRIVYTDMEGNGDLTMRYGKEEQVAFNIFLKVKDGVDKNAIEKLTVKMTGMSVKPDQDTMYIVNVDDAEVNFTVEKDKVFTAVMLYQGDDVDLNPKDKMAVAVMVSGWNGGRIEFKQGSFVEGTTQLTAMYYNEKMSAKTGLPTYVGIFDADIPLEQFVDEKNFMMYPAQKTDMIEFGDANGDGVINAQDALAAVDAWLRKGDAPADLDILHLNVNGDSRINTFDVQAIKEYIVSGVEFYIINKVLAGEAK